MKKLTREQGKLVECVIPMARKVRSKTNTRFGRERNTIGEDAEGEALLAFCESALRYDGRGKFSTFVQKAAKGAQRIAISKEIGCTRSYYQKFIQEVVRREGCSLTQCIASTNEELQESWMGRAENPEVELEKKRMKRRVREEVLKLPPNQRDTIVGLFFQDFTGQEYAKEMGIHKSTVSQRKLSAMKKIAHGLSEYIQQSDRF